MERLGETLILLLLCNKLVLDEVVESKGFGRRGMRREKEDEKGGAEIPVNS